LFFETLGEAKYRDFTSALEADLENCTIHSSGKGGVRIVIVIVALAEPEL